MEKRELLAAFPGLTSPQRFELTSPRSRDYNCIAWAAGETHRRWWPDRMLVDYWPKTIPRVPTLPAFMAAFSSLGYEACENPSLEPGFEKVAFFAKPPGTPTHAARQLSHGTWTSKLGDEQDI